MYRQSPQSRFRMMQQPRSLQLGVTPRKHTDGARVTGPVQPNRASVNAAEHETYNKNLLLLNAHGQQQMVKNDSGSAAAGLGNGARRWSTNAVLGSRPGVAAVFNRADSLPVQHHNPGF